MKKKSLSDRFTSFKKVSLAELNRQMGSNWCYSGCSAGVTEDCKDGGPYGQTVGDCEYTGNVLCAKFCTQ